MSKKATDKGAPKKAKKVKKGMDRNKKYALIAAGVTVGIFAIIIAVILIIMGGDGGDNSEASQAFTSVPQVNQAGDVAESYTSTENLYTVPDLKNVSLAEILNDDNYDVFKFSVSGKRYDNQVPKGAIIEQSVKANTNVHKDTEITVVVSLGPQNVTVPSVKGKTKDEAIIALLNAGFLYDNIDITDKWDDTATPLKAIETDPAVGAKANVDGKIYLYINSFTGESETSGEVYSDNTSSEN